MYQRPKGVGFKQNQKMFIRNIFNNNFHVIIVIIILVIMVVMIILFVLFLSDTLRLIKRAAVVSLN